VKLSLADAATAMNALGDMSQAQGQSQIAGVKTDSRAVGHGDVFVCLAGERVDGHNFAAQAARQGALAIVAERPLPELAESCPVLMVRDSLAALGQLGACWRDRTTATVIAVTGSAGKTSVKELLASILAQMGETAKNYKNYNNQLGVPRNIMEFHGEERFWVLELGISEKHDMNELGALVRPDVAVIHNIGPVHLEGLGSIEGVARCKTDLLEFVQPGGRAFVSMDYPELWAEATRRFPTVLGFSTQGHSDRFRASYLGGGKGGGRYLVHLDSFELDVTLPFFGDFFTENVLAAATVAMQLGAGPDEIQRGLETAELPEHRNVCIPAGEWTVLDDTYNANPLSMERAIANARELAGERPLVCVLGDMKELGPDAAKLHAGMAQSLAENRAAAVFFHGEHADDLLDGLRGCDWNGPFFAIDNPATLPELFAGLNLAPGVALFKGSRSMRMERFADVLTGSLNGENQA